MTGLHSHDPRVEWDLGTELRSGKIHLTGLASVFMDGALAVGIFDL